MEEGESEEKSHYSTVSVFCVCNGDVLYVCKKRFFYQTSITVTVSDSHVVVLKRCFPDNMLIFYEDRTIQSYCKMKFDKVFYYRTGMVVASGKRSVFI